MDSVSRVPRFASLVLQRTSEDCEHSRQMNEEMRPAAGRPPDSLERCGERRRALEEMGWRVLTIWKCEVGGADLDDRIDQFLRKRDD